MEYQEIAYIAIAAFAALIVSRIHNEDQKLIKPRIRSGSQSSSRSRRFRSRSRSIQSSKSQSSGGERSPSKTHRKAHKQKSMTRYSPYNSARSCDETPSKIRKRLHIATEILTSERSYVQSMDLIHQKIYEPLQKIVQETPNTTNSWISRRTLNSIFSNFQDIRSVNHELLRQLEERLTNNNADGVDVRRLSSGSIFSIGDAVEEDLFAHDHSIVSLKRWNPCNGKIGDIFLNLYPFFKMYAVYVRNFGSALETLNQQLSFNEKFKTFLQEHSSEEQLTSLGVSAYLLMPVQRIPRYRLLLQDLLNNTPEDHPDHANITQALGKMESVADFVNEQIRLHENALKVYDIQQRMIGYSDQHRHETSLMQPGRKLLKEGRLMKVTKKDFQPRIVFLFNDIIVYAIAKRSFSLFATGYSKEDSFLFGNEFVFRHTFALTDIRLVNLPEPGETNDLIPTYLQYAPEISYSFLICSNEKSIQLFCSDHEEKMEWLRMIQTAMNDSFQSLESRSRNASLVSVARERASTDISLDKMQDFDNEFIPPIWLPDEATLECMVCNSKFSIFKRRHHCRMCGSVVCNTCSGKTIQIPYQGRSSESRVCDVCYFERFKSEVQIKTRKSREGFVTVPEQRSRSSLALSSVIADGGFVDYVVVAEKKVEVPNMSKTVDLLKEILRKPRAESSVSTSASSRNAVLGRETSLPSIDTSRRERSKTDMDIHQHGANDKTSFVDVKTCQVCSRVFGMIRWKYECEKCFRVSCGSCVRNLTMDQLESIATSPNKRRLPKSPLSQQKGSNGRNDISTIQVCQLCCFGVAVEDELPIQVGVVLKVPSKRNLAEYRLSSAF